MITPKLEELIWEGRATFKTFVAGGSGKPILNIEQDRFIVITDITYFNQLNLLNTQLGNLTTIIRSGLNTQLTILGERGFNRFVFRNNFNLVKVQGNDNHLPFGSTKIDTYLIHTNSVSFTFSMGHTFDVQTSLPANENVPAYPQPLDYGKTGAANQPSIRRMTMNDPLPLTWKFEAQNLNLEPSFAGDTVTQEFSYPVTPTTDMNTNNNLWQHAAPLLHVNYVEIKGLPNNINSK